MALEIERKFLLSSSDWKKNCGEGDKIIQGFLNSNKERTVRIRLIGKKGILTIKGITVGATRPEFEYNIPYQDALELIELCERPLIQKTRYEVPIDNHIWEIDVFEGENEGLTVAEIELKNEDETFKKPDWVGEEVSDDPRYYNSSLIKLPFKNW